jgi:alpha-glucosidase (family GH31 glycosyl hydrolase)
MKLFAPFACTIATFTFFCAFSGYAAPMPPQVSEDSNYILVRTGSYTLKIGKAPYTLSVIKHNRVILQTDSTGGTFFDRAGSRHFVKEVTDHRQEGNMVRLTTATTSPETKVHVYITLFERYLNVEVSTAGSMDTRQLGERFLLKSSGHWYGGNVTSAQHWPLETGKMAFSPFYATSNQTAPMWQTSRGAGLFVPTYQPITFEINQDNKEVFSFGVQGAGPLNYQITVGNTIVETHQELIRLAGKPKVVPPKDYFKNPIFNTWIQYMARVNQQDVLSYAGKIRAEQFPASIIEIDDKWTPTYGDLEFDRTKFPDPEGLMIKLRKEGFQTVLWVTPFIEPAAKNYAIARKYGYLLMDEKGRKPYLTKWWNGTAAMVDLSNPKAYEWFLGQLRSLEWRYGVAGFKLDAGDAEFLAKPFRSHGNITANQYTDLFAGLGKHFQLNELRVSWLTQSLGLVQRLRDKAPNWGKEDGLGTLIPHGLTEGFIGYPYFCPDMIGGGLLDPQFSGKDFQNLDRELFIRWTQASALMPMMQFSYAPWKLDDEAVNICRKYAQLHAQLGDYIYSLAKKAQETGMPIARPLFFTFPEDERTYTISDAFMLGDKFLVAPVLQKGVVSRSVYLPGGTWVDFWSGDVYEGGKTLENYPAPLDKLPLFQRLL